ncbi:hypothetical protein HYW54_03805 [Candidatus Gottesmanbacteria bacterium]|nr:hypothetical protein [Candidatus Gottesmanbacteria bacterium]
MTSSPKNQKRNPAPFETPEKLRDSAASILNPVRMLDQLFGKPVSTPESYSTPSKQEKPSRRTYQEMVVFMYTNRKEEVKLNNEMHEIKSILDTLKRQVKLLEKSEKALVSQVTKIQVEQLPQKPGVYYLRFFEWLISLVRQIRAKVEEGRTWLQAMSTKKKKMGYWKMYKKHGTTFGLSHERTLATQSG